MALDSVTSAQGAPNGQGRTILGLVLGDLITRSDAGLAKYGERLRANNGRDATIDLYQELLDAVMYLRQYIEEQRAPTPEPTPDATKSLRLTSMEAAALFHELCALPANYEQIDFPGVEYKHAALTKLADFLAIQYYPENY